MFAHASATPFMKWLSCGAGAAPGSASLALFEQRGDQRRRARGAVGLDRPVVDLAADLSAIAAAIVSGVVAFEVHAAAGAVALEPVADVEVLLEVVAEREVEERPAGSRSAPSTSSGRPGRRRGRRPRGGGRGRARRREPRGRRAPGSVAGSMRGPATTIIRSAGTRSFASGKASITRRSRCAADARAADGDDADLLVRAVAELGARAPRGRRTRRGRSR